MQGSQKVSSTQYWVPQVVQLSIDKYTWYNKKMNAFDQQVLALTSIFPTHDQSVIRMALEVNGYNPERSTSWLLEMNTSAQTPSGKSKDVAQTTTHTTLPESPESILPPNFLRLPGMEHYTSASQFQPRRKSVTATIATAAVSTNRANDPTILTATTASSAQESNSDTIETRSLDDAGRVDSVGVDEDADADADTDEDDDDESESGEDEDGLLFRP